MGTAGREPNPTLVVGKARKFTSSARPRVRAAAFSQTQAR